MWRAGGGLKIVTVLQLELGQSSLRCGARPGWRNTDVMTIQNVSWAAKFGSKMQPGVTWNGGGNKMRRGAVGTWNIIIRHVNLHTEQQQLVQAIQQFSSSYSCFSSISLSTHKVCKIHVLHNFKYWNSQNQGRKIWIVWSIFLPRQEPAFDGD